MLTACEGRLHTLDKRILQVHRSRCGRLTQGRLEPRCSHACRVTSTLVDIPIEDKIMLDSDGHINHVANDVAQVAVIDQLQVQPGQVFGFLLHHPEAMLAVSVASYVLIPRLFRLASRYLIFPAFCLTTAAVVLSNPPAAFSAVAGVL